MTLAIAAEEVDVVGAVVACAVAPFESAFLDFEKSFILKTGTASS
jgi:hypothetical protein